jgi:hypothetical protein
MFGTHYKLSLPRVGIDERTCEIAAIIAEETEHQRAIKREEYGDTPKSGLLAGWNYADTLKWDLLLTFDDCAARCAKRAGVTVLELVEFARTKCHPDDPWVLFWFGVAIREMREHFATQFDAAQKDRALEEARAKQQRIQEGAMTGGKKSAESRRRSPPVIGLTDAQLLAVEQRLLSEGKQQREVAGVIAMANGWKEDSVRKRLRNARKNAGMKGA